MKRQYYPTSAARRRSGARMSLAAILLLATPLLVWGQAGQEPVTYTRITEGILVTDTVGGWTANWVDYDDDGHLDVTVAQGNRLASIALYHNEGDGTFTKVTTNAIAQTSAYSWMHVWGDYDNDGRVDLFVPTPWGNNDLLFHNEGNGLFTRIATGHPVTDGASSDAAVWGDYDRDGFLDLYVTTLGNCPGEADLLYRSNGDGTFQKTTAGEVGPILSDRALNDVAVWADVDNDGWPELWRNRGGGCGGGDWWAGTTNEVWRRADDGKFYPVDIGEMARGAENYTWVSWGDYDNDGLLDGAVASSRIGALGLYRNLGRLQFTNVTASAIPGPITNAYPNWAGDYDNDGWLDLVVSFDTSSTALYRNNGDGTFTLTNVSGLTVGRGWPYLADYNNDGFLDVLALNGLDVQNSLFRHNGNGNHWLKVKLDGQTSNRSGIGAKVRVYANIAGKHFWQMREISSQGLVLDNGLIAHFGLGDATNVEILRIEWPSGRVSELSNVAANQILTIPEIGVVLTPRTVLTAPGSNLTLRATVVGLTALSLQWKLNGTNVPGATADTLVFTSIQVGDAGTYTVEATDATGTYLSNPCLVTVFDKPVITQQPQPASVLEGKNTNFTVAAISATPIRYQWRFKSITLTDQTNRVLNVTNVQAEHDGEYDVVVSDDHGSTNSAPAKLTVLLKPRITLLSTNYTVVPGGTVILSVECTGALPMTYRWRSNNTTLKRETLEAHQSFLVLPDFQANMGGPTIRYTVILTNAAQVAPALLSSNIYVTLVEDTDGDTMPNDWEVAHGLDPNDPSDGNLDNDHDGVVNRCECQCGTDPNDPQNYLKVDQISASSPARIEFLARANRTYKVQYSEELADPPAETLWHTLADVVAGPDRTVVLTDPAASGQRYYRLVTPRQP